MQGIPHVVMFIDDILVTEASEESHLSTLAKVLVCIEEAGVCLKKRMQINVSS